jgi:hypothetical protein
VVVVLGLGIIPLVLWILFAYFLYGALSAGRGATRVTGEITGAHEYFDRGQPMFFATFKAITPDGRQVNGKGTIGTSSPPTPGRPIALFYNPSDGSLIEATPIRLIPAIIVGLLALVFTIGVGAAFLAVIRAEVEEPQSAPARDHSSPKSKHGH